MRIFVSYSRAQFYFAEDLVLALRERGASTWFDVHRLQPGEDWDAAILAALRDCDGVVLVASAEALASPQVRSEVERARQLRKPVVVAAAERVDLPAALARAPLFDLRRGFDEKLEPLLAALGCEEAGATGSPWSGQAPVVCVVCGALLGVALCWAATAVLVLVLVSPDQYPVAWMVAAYACYGVISGWLWWTTSHRRRGWIKAVGVAFVLCVPGALLLSLSGVVCLLMFALTLDWSVLAVALGMLSLGGVPLVAGLWALRSSAFYRWLPPGEAPRWMRRRALARRGHRPGGALSAVEKGERGAGSSSATITYAIHCLDDDGSIERALDRSLTERGHRRVTGPAPAWHIVVVSDLTPIAWLHDTMAQITGRVVVVISAPISTAALADVAAYQWIDHRRRSRRSLERLAASIGGPAPPADAMNVPESLGRRVLPLSVLALTAYCRFAAVLAVALGIGCVGSAGFARLAESSAPAVFLAGMVGGLLLIWAGSGLLTRAITLRATVAFVLAVPLIDLVRVTLTPDQPLWRHVGLVLGGLALLLVFGKTVAGWLPARNERATGRTLAVDVPPWWRRPMTGAMLVLSLALGLLMITFGSQLAAPT